MFCRTNILIQVENDQNAQKRKRNADSIPKYQAKAHLHIKSGPSTKVGGAQVHPGTDHAKAVVSQPHLGAGTPLPPPLGPIFLRRLMLPCYGGSRVFPIFPALNRPSHYSKKRARAHSQYTQSFGARHLTTIFCTLLVLVVLL